MTSAPHFRLIARIPGLHPAFPAGVARMGERNPLSMHPRPITPQPKALEVLQRGLRWCLKLFATCFGLDLVGLRRRLGPLRKRFGGAGKRLTDSARRAATGRKLPVHLSEAGALSQLRRMRRIAHSGGSDEAHSAAA